MGSFRIKNLGLTLACVAWLPTNVMAQQRADTAFAPVVPPPAYPEGAGPSVCIDEAHHNFHTASGRYLAFARLLRHDGFRVQAFDSQFEPGRLATCDVLVIANALHETNVGDWSLPTPSAFSGREISAVHRWVAGGGALLLAADHMPFPGAAATLARAFGFTFTNGFAFPRGTRRSTTVCRTADRSLVPHLATERIDSVVSFTGQAFRIPPGAAPLLTFRSPTVSLQPDTAWQFHDETPTVDVTGWHQGAMLEVDRGRIAVFGEAAMFSAQRAGPRAVPMGMNAPPAEQNAHFVLNVLHWLAEPIRPGGARHD